MLERACLSHQLETDGPDHRRSAAPRPRGTKADDGEGHPHKMIDSCYASRPQPALSSGRCLHDL